MPSTSQESSTLRQADARLSIRASTSASRRQTRCPLVQPVEVSLVRVDAVALPACGLHQDTAFGLPSGAPKRQRWSGRGSYQDLSFDCELPVLPAQAPRPPIAIRSFGICWSPGPGPANTTFDLGSSEYTRDAANLSVLPSVLTLGGFADSCMGLCRTDECDEGGHEFFQTVWNQHTGNDPHRCGNQAICSEANGHESCYEGSMRLDPIDVYAGVAELPGELRGMGGGGSCGAVVVWTNRTIDSYGR